MCVLYTGRRAVLHLLCAGHGVGRIGQQEPIGARLVARRVLPQRPRPAYQYLQQRRQGVSQSSLPPFPFTPQFSVTLSSFLTVAGVLLFGWHYMRNDGEIKG